MKVEKYWILEEKRGIAASSVIEQHWLTPVSLIAAAYKKKDKELLSLEQFLGAVNAIRRQLVAIKLIRRQRTFFWIQCLRGTVDLTEL